MDAIGNRLRISRPGFKPAGDSDFLGVRFMSYDQHARLTQVIDSVTAAPDNYELVETYQYDAGGTQSLQYTKEWNASSGTLHDATKSYPSIGDKLSVVNRQIGVSAVSDESRPGRHAVYQENWYDALGRRVLVRAQKSSVCNSSTFGDLACKSFVERTVWDGDQVLLERRADGASGLTSGQLDQETSSGEAWGEVVSLHAVGLDAPIAVRKAGRTTIAPYANWQGDYEIGTTADGTATSLCSGTATCPLILWPGSQENADGLILTHAVLNTWWGSLITEKLDASGLKYMRNRYYNPQTGQFTQQDPIGLAGGLNLYGFAGGDPVNFSDPFGLCPPKDENTADCEKNEVQRDRVRAKAQKVGDFAAGFGDFVTFDATRKVREMWDCGGCVDYSSGVYTAGQVAGGVAGLAEGGLVVARGFGVTSRIAIHGAHHTFPLVGEAAHVQVNMWRIGAKGSGMAFRIPLPWR